MQSNRSRDTKPELAVRRLLHGAGLRYRIDVAVDDARAWCEQFFDYYNHIHRHQALGLHTPASVHDGTATEIRAQRAVTLDAAYAANPSRFTGRPIPSVLPAVAWINEPQEALIRNV